MSQVCVIFLNHTKRIQSQMDWFKLDHTSKNLNFKIIEKK